MAARVHTDYGTNKSRAWCDEHKDGTTATRKKAQAWADQHNAEQHPNEETVTGL